MKEDINEENREREIRRYHGVDYDDYGYDEFYGRAGYPPSREADGYYKNGIWYPKRDTQTTLLPQQPAEIEYTANEIRSLKLKYSKESVILSHLREKTEKSEELFKYISYIYQEFNKIRKQYEEALEDAKRLSRIANYHVLVNDKDYYMTEYFRYDNVNLSSVYIARRIGLKEGDIIKGYNSTTKLTFNFLGGANISGDLTKGDFVIYKDGTVCCKRSGIYDIEIKLKYGKDSVVLSPTKGEYSKYEITKMELSEKLRLVTNYIKSSSKLEEKYTNILDSGKEIDPDNLKEAIKCWQYLTRITRFDVYDIYDKKVKYYGTSY